MTTPLHEIVTALNKKGVAKAFSRIFRNQGDLHLKNLTAEAFGDDRAVKFLGRWVTNFGSDSFLGLDRDRRIWDALTRGLAEWGTHNGTSRAFSSARPNVEAEEKIARWMGTDGSLIYPSVTLANHGAIPALVSRDDVILIDRFAHNSIYGGVKIAASQGTRTAVFAHNDAADLQRQLKQLQPYNHAMIAVDGVYSMSGELPPLRAFQDIALANKAFLYIDDAHGTGVIGTQGRGTVLDALGTYDNTIVVGSLSKAFSCFGGFIACDKDSLWILQIRSNPIIFGGPVPPCYLEAVCAAVDIIASPEYHEIRGRLDANIRQFLDGVQEIGFQTDGSTTPIISLFIGEERDTLWAGRFLFDEGYYVQSVIFPAVPNHAGVLRIQINANHKPESIQGLLDALKKLHAALDATASHLAPAHGWPNDPTTPAKIPA